MHLHPVVVELQKASDASLTRVVVQVNMSSCNIKHQCDSKVVMRRISSYTTTLNFDVIPHDVPYMYCNILRLIVRLHVTSLSMLCKRHMM